MTSQNKSLDFGLPAPITTLTMEQDFMMRVMKDKAYENYHDHKEEIITLLLALQKQNFVLGNSLTNVVRKWTIIGEAALKSGISSEIKS